MAIDCLVRVSFQTSPIANQAANTALVGHASEAVGTGPFHRVNTAMYRAFAGADGEVINALNNLVTALNIHAAEVDHIGISLTRRKSLFNVAFDADLLSQLLKSKHDIAMIEVEIAKAANAMGDSEGQTFTVAVGSFNLQCTQQGSKQGRSFLVVSAPAR